MSERKAIELKRKGFTVTEVTDNCNQRPRNQKRSKSCLQKGFAIEVIDNKNNCDKSLSHIRETAIKSTELVINEINNNFEPNICENNEMNDEIDFESNESEIQINEKIESSDENESNFAENNLLSDSKLHKLMPYKRYLNRREKELLKVNGIELITGIFTEEETEILTRNWNKFCDDFSCDELLKLRLLGYFAQNYRRFKDQKEFEEFVKRENFMLRLGKDLPNRTLLSIYYKAKTLFCPLRSELKCRQIDSMIDLSLEGDTTEWTEADTTAHSRPSTLTDFVRTHTHCEAKPLVRGPWTDEEVDQLFDAMKQYLKTRNLKKYVYQKNIPFLEIRNISGLNRNSLNIEQMWRKVLRWKFTDFDRMKEWSERDSSKLIYSLFKLCENESEINWNLIKDKFSDVCSFRRLMKNWYILKSSVYRYEYKSEKEIIEFLYDNLLKVYIKTDEDLKALEDFYYS